MRGFTRTAHGLTFAFGSYYEPFVAVAHAAQCRASSAGRPLATQRQGGTLRIVMPAVSGGPVRYEPVEVDCGV